MRDHMGNGPPAATDRAGRPRLPQGVIWRDRLTRALDAGTRRPATLICAGTGWGKTALASAWAGARGHAGPIAWLTLGPEHNRPHVFWSDLLLALHTGGAIRDGHRPPDRGPALAVDALAFLRRLGSGPGVAPGPLIVVLDDLQQVTDPRVLDALAGLLRRPPARLHLVLITRAEPELPLHRLRAAGDLTEIRDHDLAFRVEEAAELAAQTARHPDMPVDELAVLVRATEGWGAGLRLALDAPAGVGPDEAAADYLVREVLDGLPPDLREFLLYVSLPDRIFGGLAEALTGRQHGRQLLEQLERSHLMIEAVGAGGWFRFHRQFRAALRQRLAEERPDVPLRLHLLAAQWHARAGSPLAALSHAAAAADWELVGRLVVDHGMPLFASADRAELVALLRRIPVDRLTRSAPLGVCAALLTYALGDVAGLASQLDRVRALLPELGDGYRAVIELAVRTIEAGIVTRWQGDMPRLVQATTEILAALARLRWDQVPAMPQYRAITLLNKGIGLLWSDRLDHADRYLWAAATTARASGAPLIEVSALGHLAWLGIVRGSLSAAEEHVNAALDVARRIEADSRTAAAVAYLARAVIEVQQGGDVEAEATLRQALHASGDQPEAAVTLLSGAVRTYLLAGRGEPHSAQAVLSRMADEAGPRLDAPLLRRVVDLAQSEIDLMLDDPVPVLTRYARRPDLYPGEQVRLAQAYRAAGRAAEADQVLAVVRTGPDRLNAVSAWLLTALAADAQGRGGQAGEALTRALSAAEPERIRRPFRHFDADRVLALAERQQWLTEPRGPSGDSVLAEITGEIPVVGAGQSAGPLSEREIDVLQYLPTVLTAAEIAENLGISVNTVKAHMRSIYRKLGAGRRREAVVTARQLGLL
ncbi:LuxR C-terminal-related transcriptional regulator [Actinoplanes palleronii]|uniref:Helix-turn-helix transcriptional regulator n=1 Tax=Actinoplanes palleronii TaxID=113570 RepID=A0ABQ4BKU1_9ACTN|nr:LuxR C-terminal-related transcriptional regulator [Actinoplanes palleronii]GIE70916.1 helix-turn-helix transcriptional regulator [Actinoplanes palleronii]